LNIKTLTLIFTILCFCFAGCAADLPQPDCGAIHNVSVRAKVMDSEGTPIPDAKMLIQSRQMNKCSMSTPVADIKLTSDIQGVVEGTIPLIFEDDILLVSVEATGYINYTLDYATYAFFAKELNIILAQSASTAEITDTP
jgi:hypothetical protein